MLTNNVTALGGKRAPQVGRSGVAGRKTGWGDDLCGGEKEFCQTDGICCLYDANRMDSSDSIEVYSYLFTILTYHSLSEIDSRVVYIGINHKTED